MDASPIDLICQRRMKSNLFSWQSTMQGKLPEETSSKSKSVDALETRIYCAWLRDVHLSDDNKKIQLPQRSRLSEVNRKCNLIDIQLTVKHVNSNAGDDCI